MDYLKTLLFAVCAASLMCPGVSYFVYGEVWWAPYIGICVIGVGAFLAVCGLQELITCEGDDGDDLEDLLGGVLCLMIGVVIFTHSVNGTCPGDLI